MNARDLPQRPDASRSAFTLIEMLLVVAILLMTVLVAAPTLARSFRGARLKSSVRSLVMAHRQARALAALRQEQFALILDSVRGRMELVAVRGGPSFQIEGFEESGGASESDAGSTPRVETEWVRRLADQIRIAKCVVDGVDQEHEGLFWIRYYPGGGSDGFEVTLADEQDRSARIRTDSITGKIEVFDE
ncbi:MAG: prepilin-type N-terminal cleavage/methylation domain-containing protein [Kiritimatiellia bacterium]|nr:prepilin-type N-terminal cleavage/methylation domain-containing protein [Kiritimatiellia bacterium]